jgi:hypothetical protein
MMISQAPGVTPKMLPSGHLELSSDTTGTQVRCDPAAAAMWIALSQSSGRLDRAADMLAVLWDADPEDTHADMAVWAGELCAAGILCGEA